jgi:hypothetical protein
VSADLSDTEWLRHQLATDDEVPPAEPAEVAVAANGRDGVESSPVHELDAAVPDDDGAQPGRFDHRVAVWLGGVAAAGLVAAVVSAVLLYGHGDPTPAAPHRDSVADPVVTAARIASPSAAPADDRTDRPLPFTASAACPPGSTSAQTLSGTDPANAFVCVRDGVDGQVVDIDLGKTYVVSAISITPGWIGQDSSGASQWTQHRVVTRVQYLLTNGEDRTVLTQDTGDVHGEAVQPIKRVLASRITMLVLQTSRPPAEAPTSTTRAPGGLLDGVVGDAPAAAPGIADQQGSADPVDATFAISNLKIIGHEAI